jgi:hypothetical protein
MTKVWDFLPEFTDALTKQLEEDDKRWGDTWLQRIPEGQEVRIEEHIKSYFDQWRNAKHPIPWLKIAGLALIAWVRENHLELWNKE